jgi:hypothetical protein
MNTLFYFLFFTLTDADSMPVVQPGGGSQGGRLRKHPDHELECHRGPNSKSGTRN